jgi:hypothetical protein
LEQIVVVLRVSQPLDRKRPRKPPVSGVNMVVK